MAWIDTIILSIIVVSAVIGLLKGLIRELVFIAALVIGFVLAFDFAAFPAQWVPLREWHILGQNVSTHNISYVVSFIVIVVGMLLLGNLLSTLLTSLSSNSSEEAVSWFNWNRLFGLVFGVIRGVLIVIILVALASLTGLTATTDWRAAKTIPVFERLSYQVIQQLPSEYKRHFLLQEGSHKESQQGT